MKKKLFERDKVKLLIIPRCSTVRYYLVFFFQHICNAAYEWDLVKKLDVADVWLLLVRSSGGELHLSLWSWSSAGSRRGISDASFSLRRWRRIADRRRRNFSLTESSNTVTLGDIALRTHIRVAPFRRAGSRFLCRNGKCLRRRWG